MAFNLIGHKLPSTTSSLMNLPPIKFWIHETVISSELKLARGPLHGVSDVASELLRCIVRGYGGNRKKKAHVMTGAKAVNLLNEGNGSRITVQEFGGKEPFARGTRWKMGAMGNGGIQCRHAKKKLLSPLVPMCRVKVFFCGFK